MPIHDLAKWMREEHEKCEELSAGLRTKVATVPRGGIEQWLAELRERYEHLRAHLHKHMALEERDGYLTPVTECRPTLTSEVNRLQREHQQLARVMDRIHAELQGLSVDDRLLIDDCCNRIGRLLVYVEQHAQRENLIVMSAFTDDLGAKD